jgi:hypothetical protein
MTQRFKFALVLLAAFILIIATDADAQGRKRPVRRLSGTYLTGTVLDAATNAPVFDAVVTLQGKSVTANKNGLFTMAGLTAGAASVKAERWGYEPKTQAITIAAGGNNVTFRLSGKPTAKVTLDDNTVHILDNELSGFRSLQPFVGYTPMAEPIQLCPNSTEALGISRTDLRSIDGPPTVAPLPSCCSNGNVSTVRFNLKSGSAFTAAFKDCYYYSIHFGGLDRSTGSELIFPIAKIKSIEFP